MKKQAKRFIALGLTISLASVPTLSEVSEANEISEIQEESFSLLSTEIDEAMENVKVNQLVMDDFALTILEQPDSVGLEVMEDLPEHQEAIREDAEVFLKDIKPKLIALDGAFILVADYIHQYTDYFASELQKVQEGQRGEQEVKQDIKAGLQDLNAIIEEEMAEVNDTHKKTEAFLANFKEDHKEFEAGVVEAEEYVEAQGEQISEDTKSLKIDFAETLKQSADWLTIGIGIGGLAATFIGTTSIVAKATGGLRVIAKNKLFLSAAGEALNTSDQFRKALVPILRTEQAKLALRVGAVPGTFSLMILGLGVADNQLDLFRKVEKKVEDAKGLEKDIAVLYTAEYQSKSLLETTDNVTTSLDNLKIKWDTFQTNIQIMADAIDNVSVNDLKPKFDEASIAWEETVDTQEMYESINENTLDPVEIDLDGIESEKGLVEQLEKAYEGTFNADEILTEEELEEFLREYGA